jgi:hypothetical protein
LQGLAVNSALEVFHRGAIYEISLDANGEASSALPTPDATGDASYVYLAQKQTSGATTWENVGLGKESSLFVFGYSASAQELGTLLQATDAAIDPSLVGILAAEATWLTAEKAAIESATDGNLLQSDGTNAEDSGIATTNVALVTGATFSGELVMADQLLTRPLLKDYGETLNAIGSIGGGSQDIDLALGNVVSGTVDTAETTFTFSNPPASGRAGSFTLFLTNGGSQTVNWPGAVNWAGGTAPTLTAAGIDILTFATLDAGTTWYGFAAGLDMS